MAMPTQTGGSGLSGPALARQGIPQEVLPGGPPDNQALSEVIQMLQGGQAGSERFMQLLSILAASTAPQMEAQGQSAPVPNSIEGLLG